MADTNPILRGLLDSLNSIDQRLSFVETVLRVEPESRTAAVHLSGSHSGWIADDIVSQGGRWFVLPSSARAHAPSSFSSSSSSSSPFSLSSATLVPSGDRTPSFKIARSVSPNNRRLKRPRLQQGHLTADGGHNATLVVSPAHHTQGDESHYDVMEEGDGNRDECDDDQDATDAGKGKDGAYGGGNPQELQPSETSHHRLEALPEGFLITGRATLQEELDGWTIPRGYSMRINGTRSHGRRQKIRMVCFRGGRSRLRPREDDKTRDEPDGNEADQIDDDAKQTPPQQQQRRRQRKPTTDRISKKCECPFRFELVEVSPGADRYAVHYTNDDHRRHNHAAADLMLDPRARKLPGGLKDEVDQWLRGAGTDESDSGPWTIAKIQAELQRRGYGHVLDFDLRNRKRALLHKERMAQLQAGETATADGLAAPPANTPES